MRSTGEYLKDRGTGAERVDLGFWCSVSELVSGDVVYVEGSVGVSWPGLYAIRNLALQSDGTYFLRIESVVGGRQENIVLQAQGGIRFICTEDHVGEKDRPSGKKLFS